MKVLCILRELENAWVKKYFSHPSPYFVHFLSKPLIEYYFDFFDLMEVDHVRLTMDEGSEKFSNQYKNGTDCRYKFHLDYAFHGEETTSRILLKNNGFLQGEQVFIFDGFFFLHYDKRVLKEKLKDFLSGFKNFNRQSQKKIFGSASAFFLSNFSHADFSKLLSDEEGDENSAGDGNVAGDENAKQDDLSFSKQQKFPSHLSEIFSLSEIKSIPDYHKICMKILSEEKDCYSLLGYRNIEKECNYGEDVILGKGVNVSQTARFCPPVHLGNYATIGPRATLACNVILGNYSHVSNNSFLKNSIVYDNVYLGENLTLENTVLTAKHLFRVDRNQSILTEDPLFFSQTTLSSLERQNKTIVGHALIALMLAFATALPFLLFYFSFFCFALLTKKKLIAKDVKKVFASEKKNILYLNFYKRVSKSWWPKTFFAFSLDKFPLLFVVIRGRMALVGNQPLEVSEENIFEMKSMESYRPAVFTFSSAFASKTEGEVDQHFSKMEERYFSHRRTHFLYLKTLVFSFVNVFKRQWQEQ